MNDITCIFGAQVRRHRLEKGMSQDQLACATGIERSQISKIESGLVDLQLTTAKKLADTLEVEMSDLLKKSSFETHPFVKWAGGKTQLLSNLISYMPTTYGDYYEPFIGGGALLFKLQPEHPHINDANNELLSVYRCFLDKSKCQKLMELLLRYQQNHSEEQYYEVRALDKSEEWNNSATDVERAARMIYLNKSCFNGLYRVNSKGFFNVPSGKKKTVNCFDKDNFEGILSYFGKAQPVITNGDLAECVKNAKAGDFVYFDPPYDTWDEKDSFTSYDKGGFGKEDQARLAQCFRELDARGVKVMLSNHNTKYINELYKGFEINVVMAKRMINSNASGRGDVEEVIIRNFGGEDD